MSTYSLHKSERLCSRKAVEALFNGGATAKQARAQKCESKAAKGFTVWPLRAVFKTQAAAGEDALPYSQVLIVAPKRRLRHAVDRNRAKRQMREAYRLQKQLLTVPVQIALVWIADGLAPSHRVHEAVRRILCRVAENTKPCDVSL